MTKTYSKYLFFAFVILLSNPCFSKQKNHYKKKQVKKVLPDTTKGMTEEQKKIMMNKTLNEKMYYYNKYLDTTKHKK